MYIAGKTDKPNGCINAAYEDWCGNIRYMYSCAYNGYVAVMTESTMYSLFRGDAHTKERFYECVAAWEGEQNV